MYMYIYNNNNKKETSNSNTNNHSKNNNHKHNNHTSNYIIGFQCFGIAQDSVNVNLVSITPKHVRQVSGGLSALGLV